ncbi:alpha/beta hydrolase [Flavihumibacter fluvii]|uniref:alpha/beta hydrolase n=1 Tax=Flavihumibacter fluvii TaxID=2838157 RepID=UPI001BDDED1D|nr:alpha/beta hydrolase [Flavihumibacter fluvii]ULQ53399.1 alpha/beta hydrolase [Flavihumibacter fluvii]
MSIFFLWGYCFLFSSVQSQQTNQMVTGQMYIEKFIQAEGIRLHYLDWGGSGLPLILIHPLGDSPYIFEDFAAALKNKFRIIAYSRRGHSKSAATVLHYDNSTLVSDIKILLDSLQVNKANLLGWSMGGNEITEFAIRYPERTNKLIYFESGYDLSDDAFRDIIKTIPKSPFPDSLDLLTIDAYRKWYHKFWFSDVEWNSTLEANLHGSTRINSDGSVVTLPNDSISKMFLESATSYHRNYRMIQAPALVIYAKPFFVSPVKDEKVLFGYAEMERNIIHPWRLRSMYQIKAELKNVTIKELPEGSHTSFIFLSKDSLVETIDHFLSH